MHSLCYILPQMLINRTQMNSYRQLAEKNFNLLVKIFLSSEFALWAQCALESWIYTAVDKVGNITYCQSPDISIERPYFGCLCLTIWTKMFCAKFSAWGWVLLEALQGKNTLLCQKAELEEGNALLFPHYQNSLIN